ALFRAAGQGAWRVSAFARRLRHDRPPGRLDLRRQSEGPACPVADVLPSAKPRSESGPHRASGANAGVGNGDERIRVVVARAGIDPPLAAALQRARAAATTPALLRLPRTTTRAVRFSWPPAQRANPRMLRSRAGQPAGARSSAAYQRPVSAARLSAVARD